MRLIVETGKGLPNANSYVDLTDVENHLPSTAAAELGKLSEDEQTDRLITASLFIDTSFNWIGRQKTLEQGLCWPRVNASFQGHKIADDYIPPQVKKACAMAVNLIMKSGLYVFQETGEAQTKKEKLGAIEQEYFETLKKEFINNTQYSDINNALRGLFKSSGGVITAEVLRQ